MGHTLKPITKNQFKISYTCENGFPIKNTLYPADRMPYAGKFNIDGE